MKNKIRQKRTLLNKRILQLKKTLDFKQRPSGTTLIQQDKLRSLVLLCHAEIEDYLESIAELVLENAEKIWASKHIANYNMAHLLLRNSKKLDKILEINNEIFQIKKLYLEDLNKNHGIKLENLHRLFWPLGYNDDEFSTILISELNSFGSGRGEIAHVASYKAKTALDKDTIYKRIDEILNQLASFESVIITKM